MPVYIHVRTCMFSTKNQVPKSIHEYMYIYWLCVSMQNKLVTNLCCQTFIESLNYLLQLEC